MGEIYGTCGHRVEWDTKPIWVLEQGLFGPEYGFMTVCPGCVDKYPAIDPPDTEEYRWVSRDGFQRRVEAYYDACATLQAAKRNDYAAHLSPYYNYEKSAEVMGCSTGLAMLGRLNEKVVRLALALKGNKLQVDESMVDSCRDITILAGLIALWLEDTAATPNDS